MCDVSFSKKKETGGKEIATDVQKQSTRHISSRPNNEMKMITHKMKLRANTGLKFLFFFNTAGFSKRRQNFALRIDRDIRG